MNNVRKIREIYQELKIALGESESDGDLLRAASELVLSFRNEVEIKPVASTAENARDFSSLDVSAAMADGGWRILNHERDLMREYYRHCGEQDLNFEMASRWGVGRAA